MKQDWFEMKDIRARKFDSSVWIPLRASDVIIKSGRYGFEGYMEEYFGLGSLAVPTNKKDLAEKLGWMEVGAGHKHHAYVQDGRYVPPDIYEAKGFDGIPLVLDQRGNSEDPSEWHLHQDFVIALDLRREGDAWVRPDEGYVEVARLRRAWNGPSMLEVRAEHLKDYLSARSLALYLSSYRQRVVVAASAEGITWEESPGHQTKEDRWEGHVSEIHEGGFPYGEKTAVFHAARTDDVGGDVPTLGPPDDANVKSESWTKGDEGRKLYRIAGELWRNEWVEPGKFSTRVREDKRPPTVFFITDAEGTKENSSTLTQHGRWLWFRADVIMALAHRRGGALGWYTRDTGWVKCSPDYDIHFGVNRVGLINAYAKDIARLPEWQQQIWAGYNVSPEGGVSQELLDAQVRAEPAETEAAEDLIPRAIEYVNRLGLEKLGFALLREHDQVAELLKHTHRFRAINQAGLYSLAKDIARLTVERLDVAAMQKVAPPPKGVTWGSLKSLEGLLALQLGAEKAHSALTPLVGIYELRLADAHLSASELDEALKMAGVNKGLPLVFQGYQLVAGALTVLVDVIGVLENWVSKPSGKPRAE